MAATEKELLTGFFSWLFQDQEGYLCLATANPDKSNFGQKFFHWPSQADDVETFLRTYGHIRNCWFCVNLLNGRERSKAACLPCNYVWADLDTASPASIKPEPTFTIQSSSGRYQALWRLDKRVAPEIAEGYSRRIAYQYHNNGADKSGWDLGQLLRVPMTTNFKYENQPTVVALPPKLGTIPVQEFEALELPESVESEFTDLPTNLPVADEVLAKYQPYLDYGFFTIYESESTASDDWSSRMWALLKFAAEAGMSKEEMMAVALSSKCNKYERDNRPLRHLWVEVEKAYGVRDKMVTVQNSVQPLLIPELVPPDAEFTNTFIDDYIEWAKLATDATPVYHELSAAILLSAVVAEHVAFKPSYAPQGMHPNLWGMVLGETTLTRKSTAMDMAIHMLSEVDPDALLATDGSVEGVLSSISTRPGRVGVFYRDEISGLLEGINKRDYLGAMPETFTKLYDGSTQKRVLRKEEIIVRKPIFIFFGGGIREKTYSLLSEQYVTSGFLPRFLVVSGDNDLSRLRPTGPPQAIGVTERERLVNHLLDLKEAYMSGTVMRIAGQAVDLGSTGDAPSKEAVLSPDAWELNAEIEMKMVHAAANHYLSDRALPTFERLSRSLTKLAILLAVSRQPDPGPSFPVERQDIVNAARFIQRWGVHSIHLIFSVGRTDKMRLLEKIRHQIDRQPGIYRSDLMRAHHLSSKEVTEVVSTLRDRGEIDIKRDGKSERYWVSG
jgi:hypothetical protein